MGLAFVMKQPGILFVFFAGVFILKSESKPPVDYTGLATRLTAYSGLCVFSLRPHLPVDAQSLGVPEILVLDLFLRQPVWHQREPGGRHASFLDGAARSPGTFVDALDSRPGRSDISLVAFASPLARHVRPLVRDVFFSRRLPGILLSAALLHPDVACRCASGRDRNQQRYRKAQQQQFARCRASSPVPRCGRDVVVDQREFFFDLDPVAACRATYGGNPFPEAIKIADDIQHHTSPDEHRIAVLGSEPEIYFYSHRRSVSGGTPILTR